MNTTGYSALTRCGHLLRATAAVAVIVGLAPSKLRGQKTGGSRAYNPVHAIQLQGKANGGELVLVMPPLYWCEIRVKTHKDESAAVVARRLFDALQKRKQKEKPSHLDLDQDTAGVSNGKITGFRGEPLCGKYLLTGTERGLAIAAAPKSLTLSYNFGKDELTVLWEAIDPKIDGAALMRESEGNISQERIVKSKSLRTYVFYKASEYMKIARLNITAANYVGSTPSAGSMMQLKGDVLEEVNIMPFPGGKMAVKDGYQGAGGAAAEPCLESFHCLRCQGNFRDQHDGASPLFQGMSNGLKIDFGLPTAGHPVQ